VFDTTAEVDLSRRERAEQWVRETFYASMSILWSDLRSRIGLLIIGIYVLVGTVGVYVTNPPRAGDGPNLLGAFQSMAFPLGTDSLGRGILSQLIHSTPPMLQMITAGALFATGLAVVWGLVAGYSGGRIDQFMTTIADGLMAVPGLPLVVVLAATLQPENPYVVGVILTVNAWAGLARQLRAETLKLRESAYVEASQAMGIARRTIIKRDILPNVMPLVMVNFVSQARRIIAASVGLYFLGILPISDPNWGVILNLAYQSGGIYSPEQAHWLYAPMVTIVLFSLGLLLFGQGCDRIFNPRIRARHIESDSSGPPK
jgi:peptide/nickel transport system permease protein